MCAITCWQMNFIVLVQILGMCLALPAAIRVGGFFETEYKGLQLALDYAVDEINLRNDILPYTKIAINALEVKKHDSFEADKKVCKLMTTGVAAVFGPVSQISAGHVQSICNSFAIPHIQAHWDSRDSRDRFSISLYPDYLVLSRAYRDLVEYWGWTSFTILYEDNDSLIRLQEVLRATKRSDMRVTVRKLSSSVDNYISMFKDLIENPMEGENRIIVDCHVSKVKDILHQAQRVNMCSKTFHYLFTTLDLGLLDLEDYKYGGANITSLRLVDPNRPLVRTTTEKWIFEEINQRPSPLEGQKEIPTDTALMYDAAYLFARALNEVNKAQDVETTPLYCSNSQTWDYGNSLLRSMKAMYFDGLTGRIYYRHGKRSDFNLDVVELSLTGIQKIGTWNPKQKVDINKTYRESKNDTLKELLNKTLNVVTVLDKPYVAETGKSDVKYQGFCIDLIDRIAKRLGFKYTITPVEEYGGCTDNDLTNCSGIVKELVERRSDLAVAGMTITYDREKVIDFTKPFLNLGITILYKKPTPEPPKLFSFLSPLSTYVWVCTLAGYLCISFVLLVTARFTPYEWCNPHPCNPDTDVLENQFSISNSLWFTIASLMQQGCEIAPQAISTRVITGIWWFFNMIMISSYTANLAAFLTVERTVSDINSIEDLDNQTDIKYGTLESGSTKKFFENSKFSMYHRMFDFMESANPSVYVNSSAEGVGKVKKGKYAYIGESSSIEYVIERECDLMQIGGWLDSKGYGIAFPRNSKYREIISNEILKLQEEQVIHQMKNTWWKEKFGGGQCIGTESKKTNALGVKNFAGVFVVLVVGTLAGCLVAMCEFIWKAKKNAREDKKMNRTVKTQSLCKEMAKELRFAVQCLGSSKKTLKREHSQEIEDNGVQFMSLTGPNYDQNNVGGREVYA